MAAKIVIYAGDVEDYYSFLTYEAYSGLKEENDEHLPNIKRIIESTIFINLASGFESNINKFI